LIAYTILGLSLLAGFLLIARWFIAAEPRRVIGVLRWTAAGAGLVLGGYLIWGGRQALAAISLPMLIPLLLRWRSIWNQIKAARGPSPGQSSSIRTRMLHMTLDHDTGGMEGVVAEGRFQGRNLSDLAMADLLALWRECRATDAQSTAVLEAYLDRRHGAEWREAAGAGPSGEGQGPGAASGGPMTRDEAYEILGLKAGAAPEEIRQAHRRLMQKLHPDHGGSNYLAAKINEAKDLLLGA
jgi:DnaJ domain